MLSRQTKHETDKQGANICTLLSLGSKTRSHFSLQALVFMINCCEWNKINRLYFKMYHIV